jgi:phosphatidate cytidylyltransferase
VTDRHDDEREDGPDQPAAPPSRTATEGVRILGAEEAQAAMDAGTVGRRLSDEDTRYGDVPARPDPALRPSARFPLTRDDDAPDVVPRGSAESGEGDEGRDEDAGEPDDHDEYERGISLLEDPEPVSDVRDYEPAPVSELPPLEELEEEDGDDAVGEDVEDEVVSIDLSEEEDGGDGDEHVEVLTVDVSAEAEAAEGSTPELPHWSEPPTGEIPLLLPEAEPVDMTGEEPLDAYSAAASTARGPRFMTGVGDYAHDEHDAMEGLTGDDDEEKTGALAAAPEDDDTAFDREVQARRKVRPRPGPGVSVGPAAASAGAATAARPARPRPGGPSRPGGPPRPEDDITRPPTGADLTTRVITGVGIAVLALICLKLGRDATTVLATAVVGIASLELFSGLQKRGFRPATILAVLGSIAIVPLAFQRGEFAFPFTIAIVTVFTLLWYLFEVVRARPVVNVAVTIMGFVYVGCLGAFAGLLLSYENGVGLILGVVICVVAYDVVGYLTGSQLGRKRLAPSISPNKTLEGLIGGMVASIFFALVVVHQITPWNDLTDALALGVVVAIMAPLGDLCESLLKRDIGVKDFGTLLPGHGGVLDRFDALLFCLPAVYYLARALSIG